MTYLQALQMAFQNIWSRKVRSILTMLGIVIGVFAVILIMALGKGMENYVISSFESMGTNQLTVSIQGRGSSRSVKVDDMYALVRENPTLLSAVSPTVTVGGTVKVGTETLDTTSVSGVGEDYLVMKDYNLSRGRFLAYSDIASRGKVCVVGSYVNSTWFSGDALGKSIRINGQLYTVVGVLANIADTPEEGGTDDVIYIPYSVAAKLFANGLISSYTFTVTDDSAVSGAKTAIDNALYDIFSDEDAYRITSMSELLATMSSMINIVITVLAAIAGISLVVGGIGIMNIMLVSVSERTREIGIRKALGAKRRYILRQFVIEAAVTSGLGGLIGILLGYAASSLATGVMTAMLGTNLAATVSPSSALFAFAISVGIGILFGYLPARKAARLNPIDALRYE